MFNRYLSLKLMSRTHETQHSSDDGEEPESSSDASNSVSEDDESDHDDDDDEQAHLSRPPCEAPTNAAQNTSSAPLEVPMMMDWGEDGLIGGVDHAFNDGDKGVSVRLVLCACVLQAISCFCWQ